MADNGESPLRDMTPGEISDARDNLYQQLVHDLKKFPRDQAVSILTHTLTLGEMQDLVARVRRISSAFL